jgi:hypothetical protein
MCTLTLVPYRDGREPGLRIACNRDESITRLAALPQQLRKFGERTAILPIDADTDGTWIAVNDAGLVAVVLNRNPTPPNASAAKLSRGSIVPYLMHCDDLPSAQQLAFDLNGYCFAPFRLILANRHEVSVITGGEQPNELSERSPLVLPRMFTSSGLGDQVVEKPRSELFDRCIRSGTVRDRQLDFHRHSWPEQTHLSVCMRRNDARTVSLTLIDLKSDSAQLTYFPQAPDEPGPSLSLSLPVQFLVNS